MNSMDFFKTQWNLFQELYLFNIKEPFHEVPEDDAHGTHVAFQANDDHGLPVSVRFLYELVQLFEDVVVKALL
jgi:hypothetical protein